MSRNYTCPTVPAHWSDSRETHPAVAAAIHAIAGGKRSPEAIWECPTKAEWDHVVMAVSEYLTNGHFEPSSDGAYQWGCEALRIEAGR